MTFLHINIFLLSLVIQIHIFSLLKRLHFFFHLQVLCNRTFPSIGNSNSSSKQHNSPLKVATSSRRGLQGSIQSNEENILVSSPHITLFLCFPFHISLWTIGIFLIHCFGPLHHNPNVPNIFHHESPQIETIFLKHTKRMVRT